MESGPFISVDEYLELDRNAGQLGEAAYAYEYHCGRVFALAGESWDHSNIAVNIQDSLSSHFRERGCRSYPGNVRVKTRDSYVYPDITVVCREPNLTGQRPPSVLNPVLAVEILSPSTESRDRTWKLDEYMAIPSLQEYWIVHQNRPRVLRHFRVADAWSIVVVEGRFASLSSQHFEIDITLRSIYKDIDLK